MTFFQDNGQPVAARGGGLDKVRKVDFHRPIRQYTLHQTISNALGIRHGDWKLLDHKGSGGNNYAMEELRPYQIPDTEPGAPGQLYNLASDPGETRNLYGKQPEVVADLKMRLRYFTSSGLSAPR